MIFLNDPFVTTGLLNGFPDGDSVSAQLHCPYRAGVTWTASGLTGKRKAKEPD